MQADGVVGLESALRFARAELGPDVTAQRLLILLSVYTHEGLDQRSLLARLDSTSTTALSRNLADLSEWTSRKTAGPGMVELRQDRLNLRRKQVHLTPKGRAFIENWLARFTPS